VSSKEVYREPHQLGVKTGGLRIKKVSRRTLTARAIEYRARKRSRSIVISPLQQKEPLCDQARGA
jgi:hypothetical protein